MKCDIKKEQEENGEEEEKQEDNGKEKEKKGMRRMMDRRGTREMTLGTRNI